MGKPMKARKGLTASSESLKTTVNSFCNKTVSFKIAAVPAKTNIKFMFKWICFSRPIIEKFLSGPYRVSKICLGKSISKHISPSYP
jgi:hypothetical protein